jgi:hypothetical protein
MSSNNQQDIESVAYVQQDIESVAYVIGADDDEFIVKNNYYRDEDESCSYLIMQRREIRRLLKAINRQAMVYFYTRDYDDPVNIDEISWTFSIHSSNPKDVMDMKRIFGSSVGRKEIFEIALNSSFVINLDVANDFLANPEDVPIHLGYEITEDAAKALSMYQGDLELDGLKKLSAEAAKDLVKHGDLQDPDDGYEDQPSGFSLSLNGLTELPEDVAEALSDYRSDLKLDGLNEISSVAAKALSKREWMLGLSLNGLRKISAEVAESLSKCERFLALDGLTEISYDVAKALSKHQDMLGLDGLTQISDEVAEALSHHVGDLYLNGITSLSDAAAESLSKHRGGVGMVNLTELSEAALGHLMTNPSIFGYSNDRSDGNP